MSILVLRSLLIASLLATPAFAAQTVPAKESTESLLVSLRHLYPKTQFDSVRSTPLPGIFEVVMGSTVAYVGADGRYFLFGHMFDMANMKDLTAPVKNRLPDAEKVESVSEPIRVALDSLPPLADAKVTINGKGTHRLMVFSDPRCPYCRQLDAELAKVEDLTIHTFLVPILPGSLEESRDIWCGRGKTCDTPFVRNLAAMERLRIQGTPTLISACGHLRPGALSATELEIWLKSVTRECEGEKK